MTCFKTRDGKILGAEIIIGELDPADIFSGLVTFEDVGSVHALGGEESTVGIFENRRDQKAAVLPVAQIRRRIDLKSPGPDAVLTVGVFFVLAVPVIDTVLIIDRAAVGLDALVRGMESGEVLEEDLRRSAARILKIIRANTFLKCR